MNNLEINSNYINKILYVSFNQDYSCICMGTDQGFIIYKTTQLKDIYIRNLEGGIGIISMLNKSNILGLVGGGTHPKFPPNKLIIWDDSRSKIITEINTNNSNITDIKLKKDYIFIISQKELSIYSFESFEKIQSYNISKNLFSISSNPNKTIIAFPSSNIGEILIKNFNENSSVKNIKAHKSDIATFQINSEGDIIASASEKGTIIRIFSTINGSLIKEVRRGTEAAEIYSIAFDKNSKFIACSSNKGTIHIFKIKDKLNEVSRNQTSVFRSMTSYFGFENDYINSEWSFAKFYSECKTKNIICFNPDGDNYVILLSFLGRYYKIYFDKDDGGDGKEVYQKDLRYLDSYDDEDY